jgi:hypothetical protein
VAAEAPLSALIVKFFVTGWMVMKLLFFLGLEREFFLAVKTLWGCVTLDQFTQVFHEQD